MELRLSSRKYTRLKLLRARGSWIGDLGASPGERCVEAKRVVFDFIETWRNPRPRHTALDYEALISYDGGYNVVRCTAGR
jgi:hypothetical protein